MTRLIPCSLAAALVLLAGTARGTELTFTIDPEGSSLVLGVLTPDNQVVSSAQTPNSDRTTLSGTLDVDVTPTSVQFLPTGDTQFALQADPQAPLPGGGAGTAPAQYGLNLNIPGVGGGVVAQRDVVGDATSGVLPLAGEMFDASQLTLQFVSSTTDYNLTLLNNPFVGSFGPGAPVPNMISTGTLSVIGDQYWLNISILVRAEGTLSGAPDIPLVETYIGRISALAPVPEPATVTLALVGVVVLAAASRRRRVGHALRA